MTAYVIRPGRASDFNFIMNSYLKSYRNSPEASFMLNDIYFPEHSQRMQRLLKTSQVLTACAADDPDQILGYIVTGKAHYWAVVHYLYIKYPFRQMGVAKALVAAAEVPLGVQMTLVSHLPKNYSALSTKYKLVFDPKYAKDDK